MIEITEIGQPGCAPMHFALHILQLAFCIARKMTLIYNLERQR